MTVVEIHLPQKFYDQYKMETAKFLTHDIHDNALIWTHPRIIGEYHGIKIFISPFNSLTVIAKAN